MPALSCQRDMAPTIPTGAPSLVEDICTDSVGALARVFDRAGPLVAFPKGDDLTVCAFTPEANRAVFCDPSLYYIAGPPGPRGSSQRRFQRGMFGLNGAQHLAHRRLLMPALKKETVISVAAGMGRIVETTLDRWQPGQTIDLFGAMKELSLDIAAKLLFGMDEFPAKRELAETFQAWLDDYIACYFEMVLPAKSPAGSYERMLAGAVELEARFRTLIEQRQASLAEGDGDVLALLLHAHRAGHIQEDEVIAEVQAILNASYQTTASAMTWTLLLLAQHPEIAGRLYDSLDVGGAEMCALLDGVIKESMRILPPVVFTLRQMTRRADFLGRSMPAGTFVIVSYYVTHHMPDIFPDPERFVPDRWLGRSVSPYAYLPFSAGPRMCMGTAFSLQLFQIAIPAIMRRFRLALSPNTVVNRHSNLTLGVHGTLPVTLIPQDGRFSAVPLVGDIHEMVRFPRAEPVRIAA